ncbi:MAG: hypothetical protein V1753_07380 [Pseudomonadota bacterium]
MHLRRDRATLRRIKNARFPVIKTLDQFSWNWPKSINRMAIQNLFRLQFHLKVFHDSVMKDRTKLFYFVVIPGRVNSIGQEDYND